jgi:hypothetical protein
MSHATAQQRWDAGSAPYLFGTAVELGDDARTVERPAPGAAPTAFRIWRAGENMSDYGPAFFTPRSAQLLLDDQDARGNIYSFDFDHLSLKSDRPAEAGRAAGWHLLETRIDEDGQPELWASAIEWCADVKAGLEETPPRWRFYSPAFDTDQSTQEIVGYINCAVCINPATWQATQLANLTNKEQHMKLSKEERATLAVLAAMRAKMGDDAKPDTKAAAAAMYAVHGGDESFNALTARAAGADEGDDEDGDEPAKTEATTASAETATATTATTTATARTATSERVEDEVIARIGNQLTVQSTEIAALREKDRLRDVDAILRTRKDLPADFLAEIRGFEPERVRRILSKTPKLTQTVTATSPTATRGETQGTDGGGARDPKARAEVRAALNIQTPLEGGVGWSKPQRGVHVLATMTPSEARARALAGKKAS